MSDVTHPAHYGAGKIEVIEAIEDWGLSYHCGNAVKYIARAGKKNKDKETEDLQKAIWYLNRRLEIMKENPRRPNDMNPRETECLLTKVANKLGKEEDPDWIQRSTQVKI